MQTENKPAMEVKNLSFAYGKNRVLKDISFRSKRGVSPPSWEPTAVEKPRCFL